MKILVTGGAGFIGSAVCRFLIEETSHDVVNMDALTYAADLSTLDSISQNDRYFFEHVDITDEVAVNNVFESHKPNRIMHLAAESHVDRSIDGPGVFIQTNIVGTYVLLQASRRHWLSLDESGKEGFRFHHISTDEVYGSLGEEGLFTEETPYAPNSPYSASKASADHLVRAWHETFGLPVVVSNCSNNYGSYQFPEKLIPVLILNALKGNKLPIYGNGKNIRDWLYIDDHVRALYLIMSEGDIGLKYNIGGSSERKNIDVAEAVCDILDKLIPESKFVPHRHLIEFVEDRPGHDMRYAIDSSFLHENLGWQPQETFESGLKKTVEWYLRNLEWCEDISSGSYLDRHGVDAG